MNLDWKQITHFRRVQVVSIEFTERGNYYHWAKLKRSKGEVIMVDFSEKLDQDSIVHSIDSNIPIIIHFIGKGILSRVVEQEEDYIENLLMNADPEEFYINSLDLEEKRYVSFARKSVINNALIPLEGFNDNILDIVLGPYYVFLNEIREKTQSTPMGSIRYENGIYSFDSSDSPMRPKFNGELLIHSFWAFTIGWGFLQGNLDISVFGSDERKQRRSNYRDKKQFRVIGIAAIVIFLIALVGNYFYQGYINERNTDLEAKIMVYSDNLKKIDQIDQEMLRKKQLIANSGIIRSNYFSTTLDQIGASLPSSIILDEIQIYPLHKKLKRNEKPSFNRKTIKIAGSTNSSENIDLWIEQLNELEWVDNVAILSFSSDEEKKTSFFELKIIER